MVTMPYIEPLKDENEIQSDNQNQMSISLPIAAAVTAYSRIHKDENSTNRRLWKILEFLIF